MHTSGRQNKNKLKEKHVESGEQLVNTHQGSHSLYTSFVSVDFGKNMLVTDAQIEGQLLLYNFIVYLQRNNILSKE